ncbi:MAG: hypothetical protein ACTSVU_01755 [Promethearchaeota archaeon]
MSSNPNFQALTPALGITGSSYQLQLGKVNEFWAIRLVKGGSMLANKVYKDVPHPEEIPLTNHLTGWVLSVLTIPNINTYQIQKTIGFLRQSAMRKIDEMKLAKKEAGKSESTSVKLEKIPKNVQVKRPQSKGWIKEEAPGQKELDSKVNLSPALAASNRAATGKEDHAAVLTSRKFHPIPKGDGFTINSLKSQQVSSKASSKKRFEGDISQYIQRILASREIISLIQRIETLEARVDMLEKENAELRMKLP